MPWCPKCKTEYQEGTKICSDCGTPLLEQLNLDPEILILTTFPIKQENAAKRLTEYLQYSDIRSADYQLDKMAKEWEILVSEEDIKDAKKLYKAFSIGNQELASSKEESEIKDLELLEETRKLQTEPSHAYIKREEKYKDFQSAFFTFVIFGIIGIIFTILNIIGIFHIFNSIFQYGIMILLFVIFIIIGISSKKRASILKEEAEQEIATTNAIKEWMKEHITKEKIESVTDSNASLEINYFNKTEKIKSLLQETFGELDEGYLDSLTEEFYNAYLDSQSVSSSQDK